jgi:RHS repeat-associated protein
MKRADANSYYLYDGLGSTRQLTNSSGAVTDSYVYDSFGNKIAGTGTSANPYGFTGEQQFNEADSLVFLRARYYKPSIGRFINRDPIKYKGGLNLYVYARNNPVTKVDPLGTSCAENWACKTLCGIATAICLSGCVEAPEFCPILIIYCTALDKACDLACDRAHPCPPPPPPPPPPPSE